MLDTYGSMAVQEDVTIPPPNPAGVTQLFAYVDTPGGLVINYSDPIDCFILF